MSVAKELFRLLGLSVRSRGGRTAPSVSVHVQERIVRVLDSRIEAVCVANCPNPSSRQLHSSTQCFNKPSFNESAVPLSPAVRYLVDSHKLSNLSLITATGPRGRLLKGDVLQYIEDTSSGSQKRPTKSVKSDPEKEFKSPPKTKPVGPSKGSFIDIPINSDTASAAQRVSQHKATTPHLYATVTCSLDKVFERGHGSHLLTAFLVKTAALTVQRVPESNCVWVDGSPQPLSTVSVSVLGVSGGGTVRVNRATEANLDSIDQAIKEGSTSVTTEHSSISVHHLEGADVSQFTTITNPSSPSTLSIGSTHTVLNEQGALSRQAAVTLSVDARVVDTELCCHFLETFRSIVETPDTSGL